MLTRGHKIIDVEKLNNFLQDIFPKARLSDIEIYSIANKITRYEKQILIKENK